jgi:hypothetical protein
MTSKQERAQARSTLLMIKGVVSEMPPEDRRMVEVFIEGIRNMVGDSQLGLLALTMITLEEASK